MILKYNLALKVSIKPQVYGKNIWEKKYLRQKIFWSEISGNIWVLEPQSKIFQKKITIDLRASE